MAQTNGDADIKRLLEEHHLALKEAERLREENRESKDMIAKLLLAVKRYQRNDLIDDFGELDDDEGLPALQGGATTKDDCPDTPRDGVNMRGRMKELKAPKSPSRRPPSSSRDHTNGAGSRRPSFSSLPASARRNHSYGIVAVNGTTEELDKKSPAQRLLIRLGHLQHTPEEMELFCEALARAGFETRDSMAGLTDDVADGMGITRKLARAVREECAERNLMRRYHGVVLPPEEIKPEEPPRKKEGVPTRLSTFQENKREKKGPVNRQVHRIGHRLYAPWELEKHASTLEVHGFLTRDSLQDLTPANAQRMRIPQNLATALREKAIEDAVNAAKNNVRRSLSAHSPRSPRSNSPGSPPTPARRLLSSGSSTALALATPASMGSQTAASPPSTPAFSESYRNLNVAQIVTAPLLAPSGSSRSLSVANSLSLAPTLTPSASARFLTAPPSLSQIAAPPPPVITAPLSPRDALLSPRDAVLSSPRIAYNSAPSPGVPGSPRSTATLVQASPQGARRVVAANPNVRGTPRTSRVLQLEGQPVGAAPVPPMLTSAFPFR